MALPFKVIALLPVRNEAWILEHTLSALSGFCDVIIVSDQGSSDGSQDICRRFSKVVLLESPDGDDVNRLPRHARWRLLDAARQYDGTNLLWCTDADELVSPALAVAFLEARRAELTLPLAIAARYIHLWKSFRRYRDDWSYYGPSFKTVAWMDDRHVDYRRDPDVRPLHEPRTPMDDDPRALRADALPVLHLQFAPWRRTQMKQAWYRCVEWLDGRRTARDINDQYAITTEPIFVRTAPLPPAWIEGVTLPPPSVDDDAGWHDTELLRLFDLHGIEFFEPLEIWQVPRLRKEFIRRTGRRPRPDRSYRAAWPTRARSFGRRAWNAVRRRVRP